MSIDFDEKRWAKIKETNQKWWAGELSRPLIQVWLKTSKTDRQKPDLPLYDFTSFYSLEVAADKIVDCWDYELSSMKFLGDAFPHVLPYFGPGVMAAFLGAELENGSDTVWFHPRTKLAITNLVFNYNSNNVWLNRIKDILREAVKRWQGLVQVGMTDLGGNMDILSAFCSPEGLLLDLYDFPKQVKRLMRQGHKLWWRYFDELNDICRPVNPGYSSWARIFSQQPHYMLQCDFAHMIGPDHFERFVRSELKATAERLTNAFYHLDGPGQLVHLDSILEIDAIKGIQWIPGASQPEIDQWPQVYRKICKAGKLIQIFSSQTSKVYEIIDIITDQIGSARGIVYTIDADQKQQGEAERLLGKYE